MVSLKSIATLFVAALPLGNANPTTNIRAANVLAGKYIVTLKDSITTSALNTHINWVRDVHESNISRRQLNFTGIEKVYAVGNFNAYAGHFNDETLKQIRNSVDVADVEPQTMHYPYGFITQKNSTYGLATISHRAPRPPGSREYIYDDTAGEGTTVYIIDSGIEINHPQFEGRASRGYNAIGGVPDGDTTGHGTHVAGIVGSKSWGVAKKTRLVDVKVFDANANTTSAIVMDAIEWAIKNITATKIQKHAVINLSLGGDYSAAENKLIKTAYESGILCVIAAGNTGVDAKTVSPASSPDGITVGAIDAQWRMWNNSNHGAAVHILAPGVRVLSTSLENGAAIDTGTSMAAPHVAGLAAYLLAAENITTVKGLKERIISLGTKDMATDVRNGTVNLVAYNGNK